MKEISLLLFNNFHFQFFSANGSIPARFPCFRQLDEKTRSNDERPKKTAHCKDQSNEKSKSIGRVNEKRSKETAPCKDKSN